MKYFFKTRRKFSCRLSNESGIYVRTGESDMKTPRNKKVAVSHAIGFVVTMTQGQSLFFLSLFHKDLKFIFGRYVDHSIEDEKDRYGNVLLTSFSI